MNHEARDPGPTTPEKLTRRTFAAGCAAAAGAAFHTGSGFALITSKTEPPNTTPTTHRSPVVSFHLDRPYLDTTGMATPYLPPIGTRSGQPLAELTDEEFMRRYAYF